MTTRPGRSPEGWAGTDGIIHTGIGPFDIESGTSLSFVSADWKRRAARVSFFINALDGDAPSLLTVDAMTGVPIEFSFESQTYNLDYNNTSVIGGEAYPDLRRECAAQQLRPVDRSGRRFARRIRHLRPGRDPVR